MINPYMPEMEKIQRTYHMAEKESRIEEARKISIFHPYKTEEEVLRELHRDDATPGDILSKMSPELRKDSNVMLDLIKETEIAYLYTHQSINNLDFKQRALECNPSVYDMLSDIDRRDPSISNSYMIGMMSNMQRRQIDATTYAMQFQQQFSSKTNLEQVFSNGVYKNAFENMVIDGPYKDNALSQDFTLVSTARLLRPEMKEQHNKIEKDVWTQHPQRVMELAYDDRRRADVDLALTAIEERCPEYKHLIDEKQKEYWESRRSELIKLQEKRDAGERLEKDEICLLQEAERHVEVKHRIQKEREVELAYLKRDSIERAYAAAEAGDISFSEAENIASYIDSIPDKAKSDRAIEYLGRCEAMENDIDNVDNSEERYEEARSEERTEDEIYEEKYAGNPFVSYVPENGMEHVWTDKKK